MLNGDCYIVSLKKNAFDPHKKQEGNSKVSYGPFEGPVTVPICAAVRADVHCAVSQEASLRATQEVSRRYLTDHTT